VKWTAWEAREGQKKNGQRADWDAVRGHRKRGTTRGTLGKRNSSHDWSKGLPGNPFGEKKGGRGEDRNNIIGNLRQATRPVGTPCNRD